MYVPWHSKKLITFLVTHQVDVKFVSVTRYSEKGIPPRIHKYTAVHKVPGPESHGIIAYIKMVILYRVLDLKTETF